MTPPSRGGGRGRGRGRGRDPSSGSAGDTAGRGRGPGDRGRGDRGRGDRGRGDRCRGDRGRGDLTGRGRPRPPVDPTTEVETTAGGAAGSGSKYTGGRVTNQQVQQDPLTALANEHWRNPDGSLRPAATVTKYRPDLVDALFRDEIAPPSTSSHPRRASTTKDHAKAKGPKDHTDDKDHVKTSREGGEG